MPSNHLILCHPLLLLPSVFPSIGVFPHESALRIRWLKCGNFSFSTSPSNSGLISFRIENWCFWTVVLKKTLESALDYMEIKPVNPKGNKSWIFIGRTDAEAEAPILWPSDMKNWLIGKDPDVEQDKAGGEWDDRGWDGWMASLTRWTWVLSKLQ